MKTETRAEGEASGPWEHGVFISPDLRGKRRGSDQEALEEILKHAKEGRNYEWLMYNCNFTVLHKHKASVDALIKYVANSSSAVVTKERTKLTVLHGEGGTGKSTGIGLFLKPSSTYHKGNSQEKFWDGYDPERHENIVCEEVRSGSMSFQLLKELASTAVARLNMKGKPSAKCLSKRIYLVSNDPFEDIYAELADPMQKATLIRRVDFYNKFTKGLSEYKGFSMQRMRFQDVDSPGSEVIEWLGCWYPMQQCTFESRFKIGIEAVGADSIEGIRANRNKEAIFLWTSLTWWLMEESMKECCLSTDGRRVLLETPLHVQRLQQDYDSLERQIYLYTMNNMEERLTIHVKDKKPSRSLYDSTYDLVPPGRLRHAALNAPIIPEDSSEVPKMPTDVKSLFSGVSERLMPSPEFFELLEMPAKRKKQREMLDADEKENVPNL